MTKCWIHGQTAKESAKPLKEHPGWPDRKKEYQQNFDILFAPTKKDHDWATLTAERDELKVKVQQQEKDIKNQGLNINYLEKENEKYQKLKEETNIILTKYNVKNFTGLNDGIKNTLLDRNKYKKEREQAWLTITQKDDIIKQLNETMARARQTIAEFEEKIKKSEQHLEEEQKKNVGNNIYQTHLKKDVNRLAEQRKELAETIKKLAEKEQKNTENRDKELQELNAKVISLTEMNENIQNIDQQIYTILGQESEANGLLLRSQEVVKKLIDIKEELNKEKDWWDEWVNDANDLNNPEKLFNWEGKIGQVDCFFYKKIYTKPLFSFLCDIHWNWSASYDNRVIKERIREICKIYKDKYHSSEKTK